MDLVLVRHGDVESVPGMCIGHTDVPLSASGFAAIQQLATDWSGAAPRFLFTSDLKRAQQSAQVFAARFAIEPLTDPRLRELDLGEWDGKHWDAIARSDPTRYRHWADNWVIQEAPGGESFGDLLRRTGAWLSSIGSTALVPDQVDEPSERVLIAVRSPCVAPTGTRRGLARSATGTRKINTPFS